MATILETKAFTYDELSQDAQKKVYEDWRKDELEFGIEFRMHDDFENFKSFISVYDCELSDWCLSYDGHSRDFIKFAGDLTMQGQDLINHLEACNKESRNGDYPSDSLVDFIELHIKDWSTDDLNLGDVLQAIAQKFIELWHDEIEYQLSEEAFNDLYLYQDDLYFDAEGNQIIKYDNVKGVT
jgi:hypothetical protein